MRFSEKFKWWKFYGRLTFIRLKFGQSTIFFFRPLKLNNWLPMAITESCFMLSYAYEKQFTGQTVGIKRNWLLIIHASDLSHSQMFNE